MRYGREEMLALYEKSLEAPIELKQFELLYNAREKPPIALNAFEDDGRGGGGAPIAASPGGDRYAGVGRGSTPPDARARARNFVRPTTGRNPDGIPFERERPGEENPYDPTRERTYSRRWQGPQQSWRRQTSREETDEWRADGSTRPRSMHPDRDWSERGGDRSERGDRGERGGRENKGWNSNRRTWVGDTPTHDDLPEWAEEGSLACGGTFDSSGAFHGYSNDDTSIPKAQGDSSYQLIRSHTQGSFSRSKTVEEGSEEWWASEKAKKLSPKKFDASELKYKKQQSLPGTSSAPSDPKPPESPAKKEATPSQEPEPPKTEGRFPKPDQEEKQRFDMMMKRMETMRKENSEERGNFKSVMINANNGLRQKHQNLVPVVGEEAPRPPAPAAPLALKTPLPTSEQGRPDQTKQKNFDPLDSLDTTLSDLTSTQLHMQEIDFEDYFMPPESASSGPSNASVPSLNTLLNLKSPTSSNMQQQMGRMPQTPMSQPGIRMSGPSMMATTPSLGMRLGLEVSRHMQPRKPLPYSPRMLYSGQASPGVPAAREAAGSASPAAAYSATMGSATVGPRMSSSLFMGPEGSIPMPGDIQNMQSQPPPSSQASMFPGQSMQSAWRDDKIPMPGEMQSLQSQLHNQSPSGQSGLYAGQGLSPQPPQQQPQFGASMYGGMLPLPPGLSDMWYYEDPKQITQGPFSSKEMYNWYRAGFFTSELMVRRACDLHMRPLGSYGGSVPFAPPDVAYQMPRSGFTGGHPDMHRFGLGDVMGGMGGPTEPDSLQFGSVARDFIRPSFNQQPMVESLWSQPAAPGTGDMWMSPQQQSQPQPQQQPALNSNDPRVMFFWDQQSTGGTTATILPDGKEMKTEDQILAQLRASQEAENAAFLKKEASKSELTVPTQQGPTPDLGELEKFIQKEALSPSAPTEAKPDASSSAQVVTPVKLKSDIAEDSSNNTSAKSSQAQLKAAADKLPKILKNEEKPKSKENGTAKSKKKNKEEKKEDTADTKKDEDTNKSGRKSEDPSPSKSKKEDKLSKKDLEKEKKEWLKEGFTIVKGSDKGVSKESKKKAEENKTAEEAERKRKEEEKQAADEERKRKQAEALRKQQEQQQQQQARQALEAVSKKAPWSAVATPGPQGLSHEGLSLAEIQRLEREKKLEQMKEQQAMMQLIAQQQQAALAREQEMQAGLGWARKNAMNMPGQSLAEIQAEARKQAAAAALALEEALAPPAPVALNLPWGSTHNGGGFWDTERTSQIVQKAVEKPQPEPKAEPRPKKKPAPVPAPAPAAAPLQTSKKVTSPAHEFEAWCNTFLAVFSSKIDVPTFVGFLKDIESPFEVKEYVKCYLGESKDSNDFARQFLERRSKLLRAGTVTPVDDLCSPAAAINPRSAAGLDFQEGKAKKTKKNKMLKVDARILGFSVTASEDRINVGDIDSV